MRRISTLLAGAALAAVALAGCATGSGSAPSTGEGADEPAVGAAWLDDGRSIGLVTYGSSGCPPIVEETSMEGDALVVELGTREEDEVCTADYAPRATVVGVPEGVDPASDLTIRVSGVVEGETTLAGVQGLAGPGGSTDYQPSAGWTGIPGQFVVLTWGSSTCVPVVEDAAADGSTVTVSFQTPPEDQMCTMDMAPRANVVEVQGLDGASGVEALLTGNPEYDDILIPILGSN